MNASRTLNWSAAPWIVLGVFAVYLIVAGSDFLHHLAVITALYAVLALSLNLAFGYTGLFSIAHAALFGIGAYTGGLVMNLLGAPFIVAMLCGGLAAGLVGAGVAALFARMEGAYFAIGTFALGELVRIVLNEWRSLTGGPMGLMITRPEGAGLATFGLDLTERRSFVLIAVGLLALTVVGIALLLRSKLGARMTHVRDDPFLAASLGVWVLGTKVVAFFISGAIAGIAGAVFGVYLMFIAPTSFSGLESVRLVMMVVIGGAGTLLGPVVGTALILLLPQVLRMDPTTSLILTGVILVLVVLFLPKGIVGAVADMWKLRERRGGRPVPLETPVSAVAHRAGRD